MVTGDTVNLAARLQAAAPPGGVLISHDTWRHVADLFEAEPQEPLTLKGKTEAVRTYLIARARPRPFRKETRGVAGIATRMVGREAELLTLQNTLQDVMADGELRLVTVVGEGGVGKSRLLERVRAVGQALTGNHLVLQGTGQPRDGTPTLRAPARHAGGPLRHRRERHPRRRAAKAGSRHA